MLRVASDFATALLLGSAAIAGGSDRPNGIPKSGAVPNEKTAILIAEAVLGPIYGEREVRNERLFHASLKYGVWNVSGSVNCLGAQMCLGGSAFVAVAQRDGRVLTIFHGK